MSREVLGSVQCCRTFAGQRLAGRRRLLSRMVAAALAGAAIALLAGWPLAVPQVLAVSVIALAICADLAECSAILPERKLRIGGALPPLWKPPTLPVAGPLQGSTGRSRK